MKLKLVGLALIALAVAFSATPALATTVTEGFEGSGYNFYADSGSSSGVSTTVAYSGSQSAQFTLDAAHGAYTRWKSVDLSSYGLKVSDITASAWEMRTLGRSDLAPYFLFTIATLDMSQETLAIQFSMPTMADNVWTQNTVDRTTTTFHVRGDRTGLGTTEFSSSHSPQGTLDQLAAKTYSGSIKWGDFSVTAVRIGAGLWDASQTWNGYADDVTVSGASAVVPLPAAAWMGISLIGGLGGLRGIKNRLRRQKA